MPSNPYPLPFDGQLIKEIEDIAALKRQLSEALSRLSVHVHPNDTLTADFIRESQDLLKRT